MAVSLATGRHEDSSAAGNLDAKNLIGRDRGGGAEKRLFLASQPAKEDENDIEVVGQRQQSGLFRSLLGR